MKRIAIVTVGRSDFGLYLPLLREISDRTDLSFQLIVAAAHLSDRHGRTVEQIVGHGFPIARRVETGPDMDTPLAASRAVATAAAGFAAAYSELAPDVVVLLGDRLEMHAAGVAAVPLRIPLAHIHGGELSYGAIDDVLRHSLTKLSHLHFAATADSARRIVQMGEQPWRVSFTGALSLDNARQLQRPDGPALRAAYTLDPRRPFLLVTLHPETLGSGDPAAHARTLLGALLSTEYDLLCTQPNADPGASAIQSEFERRAAEYPDRIRYVASLGPANVIAAMEAAAAMVGNSSAGIIEARHYGLPVVNTGLRQLGRTRGANVIDVDWSEEAIVAAVERATGPDFRRTFEGEPNPYGDGCAAARMAAALANAPPAEILLQKRFVDLEVPVRFELSSPR